MNLEENMPSTEITFEYTPNTYTEFIRVTLQASTIPKKTRCQVSKFL